MSSHLIGCNKCVRLGGSTSKSIALECCIPHGLVPGSIPFLIYTADIQAVVERTRTVTTILHRRQSDVEKLLAWRRLVNRIDDTLLYGCAAADSSSASTKPTFFGAPLPISIYHISLIVRCYDVVPSQFVRKLGAKSQQINCR